MSESNATDVIMSKNERMDEPDTTTIESSEIPQCSDDPFKVPLLSSHTYTKKNILMKSMQGKKGFVQGGTLSTVPLPESKPVEKSDEGTKKAAKSKPPPVPPSLKYEVPDWAGEPEDDYFLEEIKSGVIEKRIPLKSKTFFTFGRLENCDIPMAHPTVSRYHAILQYRGRPEENDEPGFYLYDLGSTHGTFLNKYKIKSNVYGRIKVGHMIKIGASTRFFILQGPEEDVEEESSLTFTELKAKREEELRERKLIEEKELVEAELEKERQEKLLEERGISWGMGEDAEEETDLSVNPYALVTNEELYVDDPKKALRLWFEREGEELNYEIEKAEKGMFVCKVVLPVDDDAGMDLTVETSGRNKKEAQVQCALEACRSLDKLGVFRPTKRESKKAKKRNWEENDYYDSDEDSFCDRTGDLEKKRLRRMQNAGKITETIETYDSLKSKYAVVIKDLELAEAKHARLLAKVSRSQEEASEELDELDAYMVNLKKAVPTKAELNISKNEVDNLKQEESRLRKLVNLTKPASLPELIPPTVSAPKTLTETPSPQLTEREKTVSAPMAKEKNVVGPSVANEPPNSTSSLTNDKKHEKPARRKPKIFKNVVEDEFEDLVWRPPQGQTGDGRTSLNDKLGY